MATKFKADELSPALVIGGCGFVGFHIVRLLLEAGCDSISVVSRHPNKNLQAGVSYYMGDITDKVEIRGLLARIKPKVIFHTASPSAADQSLLPADFERVNVQGTANLVECAIESPSVRALVYTSTTSVVKGYIHYNATEDIPLWDASSSTIPYFKTKAAADSLVCLSNTPFSLSGYGLATVSLRLQMVYGERDTQYIPSQLATIVAKQTNVQLGDGKNLVECCYVGNAAVAHLLAAKALIAAPTQKERALPVAGEAFNITDGSPQPFWEFSRRTWRHAGAVIDEKAVRFVPAWLALGLSSGMEWAFWLFTFGKVQPPLNMSRLYIQYTIYNYTFDISKAKERLGYRPVVDHDRYLKEGIQWELENHPEKYVGSGLKAI